MKKWIWPVVGPTPVSQSLETEMFDRSDYPYSDTFVREAIQNSLDARLDVNNPVVISFQFHTDPSGKAKKFLEQAINYRKQIKLSSPPEFELGQISWLTVEDFNTKGLCGDLKSRTSDFWNYWLNFGLSNKDGSGRGGRGIGRITFLISSRIHTVIGLTRRANDQKLAACGMTVLRAHLNGDEFQSTHAYLAKTEDKSIYSLHNDDEFHSELIDDFRLTGYPEKNDSGLALVIPYPQDELSANGIIASAIEHFAPAILAGDLVLRANDIVLDGSSIIQLAERVSSYMRSDSIRNGIGRYLRLIKTAQSGELVRLEISRPQDGLLAVRDSVQVQKLQTLLKKNGEVALNIILPLERKKMSEVVSLSAVISEPPRGTMPIDRFFREGMSLPDVKTKKPSELDLIMLVDDQKLATYLNFCEGKAHLDLLETQEARTKLEENGYTYPFRVKRLIKALPSDLRMLLTPEITTPDASVFDNFFAVPAEEVGNLLGDKDPEDDGDHIEDIIDPPPHNVSAIIIDTLRDGFRVRANPQYKSWPINISISMAYADGSRSPVWSEFDFTPNDLITKNIFCHANFSQNKLKLSDFGMNSQFEITGFDPKRELDTRIRVSRNA